MPKQYIKGMIWSSGSNFVAMGASLVTIMIAVRMLSIGEMGAFYFSMVLVQIASSLGDAGLKNAAIKVLSGLKREDCRDEARYLTGISLAAATLATILFAASLPFIVHFFQIDGFELIAWYCIPVVFFMITHQLGLSILVGMREFRAMSLVTAVTEIGRMILSILLLYWGYGVVGLLLAMIVSRVLAIAVIWNLTQVGTRLRIRHAREREILNLGGWLYGSSLVAVINLRMTDTLLAINLGAPALAIYSTAMQIPSAIQRIFESIKPVILSYVSASSTDSEAAAANGVRILTALLSIAAGALIVFAEPLMRLFFSDKYVGGVPVMQVLSFWMAIGIVNYFLSICLTGAGAGRQVFLLMLPQLASMAVIAVPCVKIWGGVGGAFALVISSLIGNVAGCWMMARGNWKFFWTLNKAPLRSLTPLAVLLGLAFLTSSMIFLIPMFLLLGAILWMSKAITPNDVALLTDAIVSRKRTK